MHVKSIRSTFSPCPKVFFLNEAELPLNSSNSGNLINHWSMNWAQFKDPLCYLCLAGAVTAIWSLTQEVAGSSPFFSHWIQWKHLGTRMHSSRMHTIRSLPYSGRVSVQMDLYPEGVSVQRGGLCLEVVSVQGCLPVNRMTDRCKNSNKLDSKLTYDWLFLKRNHHYTLFIPADKDNLLKFTRWVNPIPGNRLKIVG